MAHRKEGKRNGLPGKDVPQGFFGGVSSSATVSFFFGVMSMASGSCRPFLKLRTLSPIPRLISGIFLPPKKKKTIPRMMIISQNPRPIQTIPLRAGGLFHFPRPFPGFPDPRQPDTERYHNFVPESHKISAPPVSPVKPVQRIQSRNGPNSFG
jgi:hypothetical protein